MEEAPSAPRKARQLERELHKVIANFLDSALPPDAYWFPIPNASRRGGRQAAAMLRAKELKKGVPDIGIVYRGRAIFIELKAGKGRLSPVQKAEHLKLILAGACVVTLNSLRAVYDFLILIVPLTHDV